MDILLSDYINRTLQEIETAKAVRIPSPPVSSPNDYCIYPEDNGYDHPKNPYSPV